MILITGLLWGLKKIKHVKHSALQSKFSINPSYYATDVSDVDDITKLNQLLLEGIVD